VDAVGLVPLVGAVKELFAARKYITLPAPFPAIQSIVAEVLVTDNAVKPSVLIVGDVQALEV
jgi:hypothetical protein